MIKMIKNIKVNKKNKKNIYMCVCKGIAKKFVIFVIFVISENQLSQCGYKRKGVIV